VKQKKYLKLLNVLEEHNPKDIVKALLVLESGVTDEDRLEERADYFMEKDEPNSFLHEDINF